MALNCTAVLNCASGVIARPKKLYPIKSDSASYSVDELKECGIRYMHLQIVDVTAMIIRYFIKRGRLQMVMTAVKFAIFVANIFKLHVNCSLI